MEDPKRPPVPIPVFKAIPVLSIKAPFVSAIDKPFVENTTNVEVKLWQVCVYCYNLKRHNK